MGDAWICADGGNDEDEVSEGDWHVWRFSGQQCDDLSRM